MKPAAFKRTFRSSIDNVMAGLKRFHDCGISAKIFLRSGTRWKYVYKRASIERALLDQEIDPRAASAALSIFTTATMLNMYSRGVVITEIHFPRITRIASLQEFMSLGEEQRIARLIELKVIKVHVKNSEELEQDRADRMERMESAKRQAATDRAVRNMKPFGMWQPKD